MKHSKSMLERLAMFRDLPADEQRELLDQAAHDDDLAHLLNSYREQDALLQQLSHPKPDPQIRRDFYSLMEEKTVRRPRLLSGLGRVMEIGGRVAFAVVGVAVLIAVALFFRGQLIAEPGPEQGAIGRPEPLPTRNETPESEQPLWVVTETALTREGEAPATATLSPYPGVEPLPTPTLMPYPGQVTTENGAQNPASPILGPAHLRIDSWSTDGRYLAFWEHEVEDLEINAQYPAGTLTFYDVQSGQFCIYPRSMYDGRAGENDRHTWLNGARLLVFNDDDSFSLGNVCTAGLEQGGGQAPDSVERILAVNSSRDTLLVLGEESYFLVFVRESDLEFRVVTDPSATPLDAASFSPDDGLVAINSSGGGTAIIDVATGDVVQSFPWDSPGGLGDIFAPQWLDEQTVLVRSSREQGALLLTVGGDVEPVGPALFGREASPALVSEGTSLGDGSYAIIAYYMLGSEGFEEGVWYFRNDRPSFETLPFDRASFTPDGQRLFLFNDSDGQGSPNEVWWADVESSPLATELLYEGFDFPYTASAEGSRVTAIVVGNRVLTLLEDGSVVTHTLSEVAYGGVPFLSPGGDYIASAGGYSGRADNLLYAIPVR